MSFQASLFAHGGGEPSVDATFAGIERVKLDARAWIDWLPGWVRGADALFEKLRRDLPWDQSSRWMYDHRVLEPRLTARWSAGSGEALEPSVMEQMRVALGERYGVVFDSAGFNLYRDGHDGVAWHRDRIRREIQEPVVALVSLGEPRKLHFRPRGGGASRAFPIGHGDLLVTGGTAQRTWEHAVLKVAHAGPRISIAFRVGLDPRAYG
jgi:alkylated DNA repair dioxygenase AlkB